MYFQISAIVVHIQKVTFENVRLYFAGCDHFDVKIVVIVVSTLSYN